MKTRKNRTGGVNFTMGPVHIKIRTYKHSGVTTTYLWLTYDTGPFGHNRSVGSAVYDAVEPSSMSMLASELAHAIEAINPPHLEGSTTVDQYVQASEAVHEAFLAWKEKYKL